ncbi:Imm10 family immunity protein [Streptomyces sp. NPDC054865]
MTYRFTARALAAEADVDGETQAGVAEHEDEDGFLLLFTRAVAEPSARDVSLGLDTYRVTTEDQCTAYGCVREVALTGNLLTVSLDPDRLDDLELQDADIEAVLDMPTEAVDELREALVKVLNHGRREARPLFTGFPVDP